MFISTIIPTIGRPTLNRAVLSVLEQLLDTAVDGEIIVVNDSGRALPPEQWQDSERVRVICTNRRERSFARNTGAAIAKGRFLHFLDDDDWLEMGALQHLWDLSQKSKAAWLYGQSQLVDGTGKDLLRLQHGMTGNCFVQVMAGEWIPLQSSMIEAQIFFQVGGFNPRITGPEDIDLLRRVMRVAEAAETPHVIAHIVRDDATTSTDYDRHPEQSRWAREEILSLPGVFSRMRESADRPFWYGRILRAYLTSLVWNLQHGRPLTALSRAFFSLLTVLFSGLRLFSPDYFRAVSGPYQSFTFRQDHLSR